MRVRVRIDDGGASAADKYQAEKHLCSVLRVDLHHVRRLFEELPALLPAAFEREAADELVATLGRWGVSSTTVEPTAGEPFPCAEHAEFLSAGRCPICEKHFCIFCREGEQGECAGCRTKASQKKKRQRVRIVILLTVLFCVSLYAWKEARRRTIEWHETQRVAVVLLTQGGQPLSHELVEQFRARARDVEEALRTQAARYLDLPLAPISVSVFGPTPELAPPPAAPDEGVFSLLRFNLALEQFADKHDEALGLVQREFDVRIYARVQGSGGDREAAEGIGQQLGEIGIVKAEISQDGIDFAWFVIFHEFFHTRGATDKYDSSGDSRDPEGLADPDQRPLYPQPGTEVMARGRPVAAGKEELPSAPETWAVGRWTAQEIGWVAPETQDPKRTGD